MTTLEFVLIGIIWIVYGIFNAYQHHFHEDDEIDFGAVFFTLLNIIFAPIALAIRIIRGVFFWRGDKIDHDW